MGNLKPVVLWVDDEPTDSFIDAAYKYGIDITPCECVNDGISILKENTTHWDAIILDANCKISKDEKVPSLKALTKAVSQLVTIRADVPWFVYTGEDYEGVEHLQYMIMERAYDDRPYYNKPKDMVLLFDKIKAVIAHSLEFRVKRKFGDICSFYKEQNNDEDKDLVDLLVKLEFNDISTDANISNEIRKLLDWVMSYLNKVGVLPVPFTGSNLNDCSRALGDPEMNKQNMVPLHIQRIIFSSTTMANDGSHRLGLDKRIREGLAPYWNYNAIWELINIFQWCSQLPRPGDDRVDAYRFITETICKKYLKSAK